MNPYEFSRHMRTALYQCGYVAKAFRRKVAVEHKEREEHQLSTSVSDVDRVCQDIILLHAYQMVPYVEISSEEIGDLPSDIHELFCGNSSRYVLVVDPLDATDCYFSGGDMYASMLGILDQETGDMLCALVYFPELGKLYSAIRDAGAFVEHGMFTTPRRLVTGSPPRTFGEVKRLTEADYAAFEKAGFSLDTMDNCSAAYAQIRVAEGKLGAMVMRHFHEYDTAIPCLIIQELGGAVVGDQGRRVQFQRTMPRTPLVISSLDHEFAETLYRSQAWGIHDSQQRQRQTG